MLRAVIPDFGNTLIEDVEDRRTLLDQLPIRAKAGAAALLNTCRAQGWALALLSNIVQDADQPRPATRPRPEWRDTAPHPQPPGPSGRHWDITPLRPRDDGFRKVATITT